ncbi:MAG TPA: AraC family transcriptional regulator [Cellulomonas sp.]
MTQAVRLENATGHGSMLPVEVFPGVQVIYNDFQMGSYLSDYRATEPYFCIDHCKEGRIGQPTGRGAYLYTSAGDLKVDDRSRHTGEFSFPLGHYHGLTIAIELGRGAASIAAAMHGFPVDLATLSAKYCVAGRPFIVHAVPTVEHIVAEIYAVPVAIRRPYLQLKVLELLLFLDALDISGAAAEKPYFYRAQVEKVRAAHERMLTDLAADLTVADLAAEVGLSLTTFKACFKGVYGLPPFAYLRTSRINRAAVLLRDPGRSVAEIGLAVGYDSPSKFASAFRQIIGSSPAEYRARLTRPPAP